MAKYVREIINPDLFFLGPLATVGVARGCMLALGISGLPILDDDGRPVGVLSHRDLLTNDIGKVETIMSKPVKTVVESATIEDAGRLLANSGVHRLVVVNEEGRAVGIVSTLDVIRGLLGMGVHFPERFHHRDPATGVEWRGDYDLTEEHAAAAPAASGLIVLRYGLAGAPEVPIWVGVSEDIRTTLNTMLRSPGEIDALIEQWGQRVLDHCRFRTAVIEDDDQRNEALSAVRATTRLRAWARQLNLT